MAGSIRALPAQAFYFDGVNRKELKWNLVQAAAQKCATALLSAPGYTSGAAIPRDKAWYVIKCDRSSRKVIITNETEQREITLETQVQYKTVDDFLMEVGKLKEDAGPAKVPEARAAAAGDDVDAAAGDDGVAGAAAGCMPHPGSYEYAAMKEQCAELKRLLYEQNADVNELEAQIEDLTRELDRAHSVEDDNAELRAAAEENKALIADLREANSSLAEELRVVQEQKALLSKRINALESACDKARSAFEAKGSDVERLTATLQDLNTRFDDANAQYSAEVAALRGQLGQATTERDGLAQRLGELENALRRVSQENEALKSKNEALEAQALQNGAQIAKLTAENDALTQRLQAAEQRAAEAQKANQTKEARIQELSTQNEDLQRKAEAKEAQIGELNEAKGLLTRELQEVKAQHAQLSEAATALEAKRAQAQHALEEKGKEVGTLKASLQEVKAQAASMRDATQAQLDKAIEEKKALAQKLVELANSLRQVSQEKAALQSKNEALEAQVRQNEARIGALTEENSALTQQLQAAKQQAKKAQAALSAVQGTDGEKAEKIKALTDELAAKKAELEAVKAQHADLERQLAALRQTNAQQAAEIEKLKEDLSKARAAKPDTDKRVAELTASLIEKAELVQRLEVAVKEKSAVAEQASKDLFAAKASLRETQTKLDQQTAAAANLTARIAQLEGELKAQEDNFHKRLEEKDAAAKTAQDIANAHIRELEERNRNLVSQLTRIHDVARKVGVVKADNLSDKATEEVVQHFEGLTQAGQFEKAAKTLQRDLILKGFDDISTLNSTLTLLGCEISRPTESDIKDGEARKHSLKITPFEGQEVAVLDGITLPGYISCGYHYDGNWKIGKNGDYYFTPINNGPQRSTHLENVGQGLQRQITTLLASDPNNAISRLTGEKAQLAKTLNGSALGLANFLLGTKDSSCHAIARFLLIARMHETDPKKKQELLNTQSALQTLLFTAEALNNLAFYGEKRMTRKEADPASAEETDFAKKVKAAMKKGYLGDDYKNLEGEELNKAFETLYGTWKTKKAAYDQRQAAKTPEKPAAATYVKPAAQPGAAGKGIPATPSVGGKGKGSPTAQPGAARTGSPAAPKKGEKGKGKD